LVAVATHFEERQLVSTLFEIDKLVCLLNCQRSSYGPYGVKLIKVHKIVTVTVPTLAVANIPWKLLVTIVTLPTVPVPETPAT